MLKYRFILRFLLFFLGFIFIFVSFFLNKNNNFVDDGNVIFVVDISNSMNVNDVFYNNKQISRLGLVKNIIKDTLSSIDNPFGLILISSKVKYFIPPTKDKDIFLTYLDTVNTNTINGGESKLKDNLEKLNQLVDFTDKVIIFSDFDTESDIKGIKYAFNPYFVGIGNIGGGIVKTKDNKSVYLQGELAKSSLNKKILNNLKYKHKIISSYKKGEKIGYLDNRDSIINSKGKVDILKYLGFGLILLGL